MTTAAIKARTWLPFFVLFGFSVGVLITFFSARAHAQDGPASINNSIAIGALQRQLVDLGDLPAQSAALRERMIAVETTQKEQSHKLDSIADLEKWVVMGVFGILGTQILRSVKILAGPEQGKGLTS